MGRSADADHQRSAPPGSHRVHPHLCDRVGIAKRENVIDFSLLEWALRDHLNRVALRAMAVLDPIKLVITNYPEGQTEDLPSDNNPEDPGAGTRNLPFSRELWMERDDFREEANRKWFRLAPARRFGSSPPTSSNTSTTWSARTAGWRCTPSTSRPRSGSDTAAMGQCATAVDV